MGGMKTSSTNPLDDSQFDWRLEDMGKVASPHPYAGRRVLLM
ncbi:MAG: hypothetical protein JWO20_2542 [Candidatus Angelobacter sp.]|nr:hypothetical protein [Candidatus Angelobacter sp.]